MARSFTVDDGYHFPTLSNVIPALLRGLMVDHMQRAGTQVCGVVRAPCAVGFRVEVTAGMPYTWVPDRWFG